MPLDPRLLEILVCPIDLGELLYFEGEDLLYNPRLQKAYRIHEGNIPVMLVEEAQDTNDGEHRRLMDKAKNFDSSDIEGLSDNERLAEIEGSTKIEEQSEFEGLSEIGLLEGVSKHYDWGSTTAIAELFGWETTGEPLAELWFGTHPLGPARIRGSKLRLDEVIAANPLAAHGPTSQTKSADSSNERMASLPFMLKVLAAEEPLSLQVHPSKTQAQLGYEREEAKGIALGSPKRCFQDKNHKPELICALSDFKGFCGFRDPSATLKFYDTISLVHRSPIYRKLADLATAEATPYAKALSSAEALADILRWIFQLDPGEVASLVSQIVEACEVASKARHRPHSAECEVLAMLGKRYPQDPAVLVATLMNMVCLRPGEAVFLPPGTLHAHIQGCVVEVMANSDNVVRAGLTSKHIDQSTLLEITDFNPMAVEVQRPALEDGVVNYHSPVEEFSLQRINLRASHQLEAGPAIVLCISGELAIVGKTSVQQLNSGEAAWLPFGAGSPSLEGNAIVVRAGLGGANFGSVDTSESRRG